MIIELPFEPLTFWSSFLRYFMPNISKYIKLPLGLLIFVVIKIELMRAPKIQYITYIIQYVVSIANDVKILDDRKKNIRKYEKK